MSQSPADQRMRSPWPLWRRWLAYLILFAVAAASIWFVDRDAMGPGTANSAAGPQTPQ
jgi:hypothetical protein